MDQIYALIINVARHHALDQHPPHKILQRVDNLSFTPRVVAFTLMRYLAKMLHHTVVKHAQRHPLITQPIPHR